MKLAVVGSRKYPQLQLVRSYVETLPIGTVIVTGGAAGVDAMAIEVAKERRMHYRIVHPDYQLHPPKLAPLIRNADIVEYADEVVAFWDKTSGGTLNAICCAWFMDRELTVFGPDGEELTEEEIEAAVNRYSGPPTWEM